MTALAGPPGAHVEMVTREGAEAEIERLLREVGMSRAELGRQGAEWELDADQRGVLADIQGLEFLIKQASPS